jgi:hypothetical protein
VSTVLLDPVLVVVGDASVVALDDVDAVLELSLSAEPPAAPAPDPQPNIDAASHSAHLPRVSICTVAHGQRRAAR